MAPPTQEATSNLIPRIVRASNKIAKFEEEVNRMQRAVNNRSLQKYSKYKAWHYCPQ